MAPSVGEQDTSDVQKQRRNLCRGLRLARGGSPLHMRAPPETGSCFRARSMALERASKRYDFGLSTSASSPAADSSLGDGSDVSTARCHRRPGGGGGKPKSIPFVPALKI